MRPTNHSTRDGEKRSDHPQRRSRVRLHTDDGAREITLAHSVLAAPNAVIDMARRAAGVDAAAFRTGTHIEMRTTDTYQTETDRLTTELATDGGEPVVEIDVPTANSDGDHYHAPGTPCGRHLTRRSHMAAFALRERELEPCANCVANHGLDDVVATLNALGGDADPELVTDGGREVVEPDDTLRLTDEGIEMPEMLRGYVGQFHVRTADITGQFQTTEGGLPDTDFWDGPIAVYPDDDGEYNPHLGPGLLEVYTTSREHSKVYRVIDDRDGGEPDEPELVTDGGFTCEMPECGGDDDVRAVRDPAGRLLNMCASCRSEWPVEMIESSDKPDDEQLVTDGGREAVEIPLTLHYDGTGLFLWVTDDDVPQSHIDGVTMGEGGIEHLEREVFARLPEVSLCAAEKNLLTEQERSARGRSAPQVATVEYYPDDHETGGVALSFDRNAYVTLFPTERASDTPTLLADGGREVVSVEFRSSPTIEALLNAAQADPVTPAGLTTAVTHETITATGTPEAFEWLHEWLDARASVREASPRYAADIAAGMADRIYNDVADVDTRAPTAEERIVTDGGHANAVLEQLKQAEEDGDLPDELAEKHDLDGEEEGDDGE